MQDLRNKDSMFLSLVAFLSVLCVLVSIYLFIFILFGSKANMLETLPYDQRHDFWVSVVILTLFSAAGSLFIIVGILLKYRNDFSARLVLYLSVADFCLSLVCMCLCAYNLSNGNFIHIVTKFLLL